MEATPTNNDLKNYFSENEQFGIYRYQKSSPIRRQVVSNEYRNYLRNRNAITTSRSDTFQKRDYTTAPLTQAPRRESTTYRQNDEIFNRARGNLQRGADLYLRSGPKVLSESSLFTGSSNQPGTLSSLANRFNTLIQQGINQYQGIDSSRNNNINILQRSANIYRRTGPRLLNESYLFTRNSNISTKNAPLAGISTLMSRAITQYQTHNTNAQGDNSILPSGVDLYLKTGSKRFQETNLLQNL